MRFLFLTFILLLINELPVHSQRIEWLAGFDGFLDNREYYSIDNPQTIFGSRIKGEIGGTLANVHRLRFGVNYLYEFGHETDAHSPNVTMYYQFNNDRINFQIGSFPRVGLLDYPLALLSDTLLYYRPNLEGAYFGYRGAWGFQQVFIDWTSRQTDDNHERFIFGFSGALRKGILFLNHHLMMGHFAAKGIPDPDHHLRDNGGFQIDLGADLSGIVLLDTLRFSAGTLVSLDRTRGVDKGWQTPAGLVGQFKTFYKWFGIDGLYYRGQGHTFLYGDPFYRLEQYGRLDFFYMPFQHEKVSLKINFVLHFAAGQVDYSQQILVSMALDGFRSYNTRD
jgi:hypothetical protein